MATSTPYGGKDVYGDAFAMYRAKADDFDHFVKFLVDRLAVNGIDSSIFKGKKCLDAGCGSGRGSIFMLSCGASHVTGVDLSEQNVETARLAAQTKNFTNCEFEQGDVNALQFDDEQFDFVWCNGVLHHTPDTDKGLFEITRVLKVGGHMWLYLYGSGGVEWAIVDEIRDHFIKGVDYDTCLAALHLIDDHLGSISEYLDNWYTPYLRRYTDADVTARLKELCLSSTQRLLKDVGQRVIDLSQSDLLGEQNLRYLLEKKQHLEQMPSNHVLPDINGKGSAYKESPETMQIVKRCKEAFAVLETLEQRTGRTENIARVAAARLLNNIILTEMELGGIRVKMLEQCLSRVIGSLSALTESCG
ncbi:MAG: class I SAM-dependent methyltransferase [Bdellovibrionales bacterium]|nr:class I SAM-dependent methyltransferase [Bdellovibrionales bacterium]